ncbi:MAG: metallophosphoesterase, partial [Flavobacteriales bacterium]|nr:metallophosphoesterase [Flavobacteriales bacterium]
MRNKVKYIIALMLSSMLVQAQVIRGPYLQLGTSSSVIIKWRTDSATFGIVNYGTSLGALNSSVSDTVVNTDHELMLSGLTPNTKYYYDIADSSSIILVADTNMYYMSSPTIGTSQFTRAWILGDAGWFWGPQTAAKNAYYNYVDTVSINPGQTDMVLLLGDNAYDDGTDTEYQTGLFDPYVDMFKKSVTWSCIGNHDGYSAFSNSQTGPYYDIFTFPTAGEAGGVASGTEAYYSFDYGNIHFIVLESNSMSLNQTQKDWLLMDIQATTQDWIIALYHHGPYTHGTHNSDTESGHVNMRDFIQPTLEAYGIDVGLAGHSHVYERTFFINGHYGNSGTFDKAEHVIGYNGELSGRDGTSDGAYGKSFTEMEGAVYVTSGSASGAEGGTLDHNAHYYAESTTGTSVIETEPDGMGGEKLTLKFISDNGSVDDYFTIHKTVSGVFDYVLSSTGESCPGDCDGNASVEVSGGIGPYDYMWSNGELGDDVIAGTYSTSSNLCPGTYTVTVTDDGGNGNSSTKNIEVG